MCKNVVFIRNYPSNDDNDNSDEYLLKQLIVTSLPIDRWSLRHITSPSQEQQLLL